ncbi:DUF4307 domain-containing protein [Nocardioides sp.]|uniref:DUF4307 domain-containing protein n=1 Tax=Nocardioides sp. TaxID=35761 RepID=UPI002ED39CED
MTDLAARYGTPSPVRRRVVLVVVATASAALVGWLAWAALFHGSPEVESGLSSYEIVSDNEAAVVVEVSLTDDVVASCRVRALGDDHSTVGELAFEPVDGRNEVTVRTERRATSVTLVGCTAPGQPRPR